MPAAKWMHISCGTVVETARTIPPDNCPFCTFTLSVAPEDEGWRYIHLTKAEKRAHAKKKGNRRAKISKGQRERIYARDGHKCVRCDEAEKSKLTLDHITPVCRGGSSKDSNLQTMCKRCNMLKGNKTASAGMRWPPDREMRRSRVAA